MRTNLTFFFIAWSIIVGAQDTLVLDQLDYRFVFPSEGEFLPLTSPEDSNVAGLFISCDDNQLLEFCGSSSFTIWIDGRYITSNKDQSCIYLSSEELCTSSNRESPYLSLVSEKGLDKITVRAIAIVDGQNLSTKKLLVRNKQSAYRIFGFLIGCIALVTVRVARPRSMLRMQRPNLREFSGRFLTAENMILLSLVAGINAFCYSFLLEKNELTFIFQTLLMILLAWLGKTMVTLFSGAIFKFLKWANWQLIFQLRFWIFSSLLLFIFLFVDFIFFAESKLSSELIINIWCISSFMLLLLTSAILMTQKGLKNLHIFIYICTTEILPITLLVYLFLE